jgi:hypothetical protein
MISDEVLKYLNGFLLTILKNYEDLFDPSSFSDNTVKHMKKLTKHLLIGLVAGAIALPALAQDMPGEGKTVRFARSDSLGASYVQT